MWKGFPLVAILLASSFALAADPSSFFDAVKSGNLDSVRDLLKHGQDANARDDQQRTALQIAAESGTQLMMQLLLDSGAQPDEFGRDNRTALLLAVAAGNVDGAKLLLARGADPTLRDRSGVSAALLAARLGNVPLLAMVAEKGADLNAKDREGDFPLLAAAGRAHEDAVTFLLTHHVQVNEADSHGITPLIIAAGGAAGGAEGGAAGGAGPGKKGSLRVVRELVDAGAGVNAVARDEGGSTPLYTALFTGNSVIATFLLDHGADSNLRRRDGSTDFSVLRTACDLRRMPAYQDKFRDLRCDTLVEPGSYAICGAGGDSGAALAAVDIPEANTNLIKMPALRYSCPGSGGHACVIESHNPSDDVGDDMQEGHQDWRRLIRFPKHAGGGPSDSFVWTPEACGAGCGQPEVLLRHMTPAKLKGRPKGGPKGGPKGEKGELLLQPRACPTQGKCRWLDAKPVRAAQKLAVLPGPRGFYCVRVEEGEDLARYGWMPVSRIAIKK